MQRLIIYLHRNVKNSKFIFKKISPEIRPAPPPPPLNPLANKLWSPAHNEREELEPTDPVQGYDTISINDTEIRKQLSKMGRNKAYELDNLLIEAIIMVAELNLLLKDYTAEDNGKWYTDSWKKDSYGNNVFTLNVKCPMPIKNTTGGVYFIFINVLYFSLITQNLEENS